MRTRLALLPICCLLAAPAVADDAKLNDPPEGFIALFDGKDLDGWIGMNMDPRKFRAMTVEERTKSLEKDWNEVKAHWSVENGELVNDGQGPYLTTAQDYGDFVLRLDYKTVAKADSGIYLRGVPQVQIWDWTEEGGKWNLGADKGSGALWNNQTHEKFPYTLADKPFGEWNHLDITMVGDTVTVVFNDKLVVNEVVMENYWDKGKSPIFPVGPIQLQTHGGEIRFRNVYLKKIPRKPPEAGYLSKEGQPWGDGWKPLASVDLGKPVAPTADLHNFDLHAVFRLNDGKPAEVAFRTQADKGPALVLTVSPENGVLLSERKEGEPYTVASTPKEAAGLKANEENHLYLRVNEDSIQAWLNDMPAIDVLYPHGPTSGRVAITGANVEAAFVRDAADDPKVEMFAGGEEGFEPIFNGKDLTGWTGDVNGYEAEPGVLKSKKAGGNVFFDQELTDFDFRFEFKLDPGGNNGVGLRAPVGKDAAYAGIESQILDNADPQYATIQKYQAHGSLYGVVPAKRGYLNPQGHWNREEIIANGTKFQVILNGKVIVDADIKEAAANGTIDHKEHPGLFNKSGHLGFLGHGHEIEFRDLRLKKLAD